MSSDARSTAMVLKLMWSRGAQVRSTRPTRATRSSFSSRRTFSVRSRRSDDSDLAFSTS